MKNRNSVAYLNKNYTLTYLGERGEILIVGKIARKAKQGKIVIKNIKN